MAEDEEAAEIKRKRLEARRIEEQLRMSLRVALDEPAYERLANVSVANKELYFTAAKNVLMAFKRMGRKITDAELVTLLRAIKEQTETKTTITFHKK